MRTSLVAALALAVLCVGANPSVAANPADIDPTFANNGSLTVTFAEGMSGAGAVVLQPDGNIVAAGYAGDDLALVRCDSTGALDPTFGTGGKVTTDFAGLSVGATGLARLPDGRLLATGSSGGGPGVVLARYLTDGTLDPTFGVGGRAESLGFYGQTMVLQSDGMAVVGGYGAHGFMLSRFDEDGVLDPTFGTAGVVSLDFPLSNGHTIKLGGVAVQPDGKLIAVGGGNILVALARFESNGTLDPTFGTGGTTTTDVHVFGAPTVQLAQSSASAVIVQPDGKLAVAAATQNVGDTGDGFPVTIGHALVLRYDDAGAIDTSFNGTGKVIVGGGGLFSGPVKARALVLQSDGKLVATGDGYFRKRVNVDGTIDGTFATTQTRNGRAAGLVQQPDTRFVAAGVSGTNTFEIVRIGSLCGNNVLDPQEQCDDGNVTNGDGCDNNCTPTGCGNHVVTTGEACDDGNAVLGDGCRPNCTAEICGDGIPDPQEQCDDGNGTSGDGCDANCTPTGCGNDIVTAGEDCEPGLGQCCTASCAFVSLGTSCVGSAPACYQLECNGAGACLGYDHPSAACVAAPLKKSNIALRALTDAKKRSVTWNWGGPAILADIPNPFTATGYQLCVYDHAAGVPHLFLGQTLLPNNCPSCQKTTVKGWDYKQKSGNLGSLRWVLRSSNGKGNFKLMAAGSLLDPTGSLPLTSDPKVTVQLRNEQGDCWGAEFTTPTRTDAVQYKAKSD